MNFATQMIYCVVYGFTGGAYRGLTPVVAIDIMGMKKFVLGYGVQLLFMGIAMMIGPTVTGVVHFLALLSRHINERSHFSSGAIYVATGGYDAGFYYAGSIVFASSIILFTLPWIKQVGKDETNTDGQTTDKMMGATLALQSALVWQIGLPPMAQRSNSVTVVTKF